MNHLAETESLMRRAIEVFTKFRKACGHEHPHKQAVIGNYERLLQEMGLENAEIGQKISEILN